MAIAANSLTLADYALNSNSPQVRAVSYSLILGDNVMQDVPLLNKKTLVANGVRFEGNLPTVNWAPINSEGVTTKGTPTPYSEQLYLIRNNIDVDKVYVEDENQITDPRATQVGAYLKAVTYDLNYKFFQNDHITGDQNSFVGLKYRIDNGGIFGVRPENKISGGAVDLFPTGAAPAPLTKFLLMLGQNPWSVGSAHGNSAMLC